MKWNGIYMIWKKNLTDGMKTMKISKFWQIFHAKCIHGLATQMVNWAVPPPRRFFSYLELKCK